MAKANTQQKLEKKGYKITYTIEGNVIATKGQQTYKAKKITQLNKIILAMLIIIITLVNVGCSKNGYGCHGNGKYITRVR